MNTLSNNSIQGYIYVANDREESKATMRAPVQQVLS